MQICGRLCERINRRFQTNISKVFRNFVKYKENIDTISLAATISEYAGTKNINGELISDETIAEAVHDHYLHQEQASKYSTEIINILKEKLGDNT